MSLLRQSAYRSFTAARAVRCSPRAFSVQTVRRAQEGYGDVGSQGSPQEKGKNPKVGMEHPGPDAPSAAKKSSGSSASTSSSSGSSSQEKGGARPAIHNETQPDNSSEEVKRHNEEVANRQEKTTENGAEEKVDPKFWKGHADDKPQ